jgi:hypothetical protein
MAGKRGNPQCTKCRKGEHDQCVDNGGRPDACLCGCH